VVGVEEEEEEIMRGALEGESARSYEDEWGE
jgi:hypothetical protein